MMMMMTIIIIIIIIIITRSSISSREKTCLILFRFYAVLNLHLYFSLVIFFELNLHIPVNFVPVDGTVSSLKIF